MNPTLLALYGLKWNPFSPELPTEALYVPPKIENFCWRIEQALIREGGFAMLHGDPGTGKSVAMRLLAQRLARLLRAGVSLKVIGDVLGHRSAASTTPYLKLATEELRNVALEIPMHTGEARS